jgi:hypothetical protein
MGQVVPARAVSRPGNCGLACYMTLKQLIPLFVAAISFYRRCVSETNFPKGTRAHAGVCRTPGKMRERSARCS